MNELTLCKNIAALRKGAGLTQEALANKLGLTYQAISKWENGLSCPDVQLLPQIADIFNVSIDSLFGRETALPAPVPETDPAALIKIESEQPVNVTYEANIPPWEDDNTLYIALYRGHELINEDALPLEALENIPFTYEGPALNIRSVLPVVVEGDVQGDVLSGGDINCAGVGGDVSAGGSVDCEGVGGHVTATGNVDCAGVDGNVFAEGDVDCGSVEGGVYAGGDVDAGSVGGNVLAEGSVDCSSIGGSLFAGGDVDCSGVGGSVFAQGDVDAGSVRGSMGCGVNIDQAMAQMQEQLRQAQEQVKWAQEYASDQARQAQERARETYRQAQEMHRNNAYRKKNKNFEISFDMDEASSEQFREKVDGLVNGVEKMLDGLFDKFDFSKKNKDK